MESIGKLGNDEKVKFVGPMKSVRWREKTCGSQDICKLLLYFSIFTFQPNKHALIHEMKLLSLNILTNDKVKRIPGLGGTIFKACLHFTR